MKTRKYKTLKGFLNQCRYNQLTAEQLFTGRVYIRGRWCNVELSENARTEASKLLASYCVKTRSRAKAMADALNARNGDLSLFQCFYFYLRNGEIFISNSLSGEAFNYCVRMYLKKWC